MTKNITILIVDDEILVRHSIAEDLQEQGIATLLAKNGEEALLVLKKNSPDLMITDLKMEGMDGLTVLQQAREIDPNLGVIILTGYGDLESAINALRLGADDYLCKPCNSQELFSRIEKYLEKRALQERLKIYENLLPICSNCKNIRDDSGREPGTGRWMTLEEYFAKKTKIRMTHSICNECLKDHYSGFIE